MCSSDLEPVVLPLLVEHPEAIEPRWGRYVAGVVAEMDHPHGFVGDITTDIPIGSGLSSSAALEVAVALALGFEGSPIELAQVCRRAEQRASGVPCGIMDQLCIAAGVRDHALLIDCGELTIDPVAIPDDVEIVVQHIAHRTLVGSAYADRVRECAEAEAAIGPLRHATVAEARTIDDPVIRARAVHVTSENGRVLRFAEALRADDLRAAGQLMVESHRSLAEQFETSTPMMDTVVEQLRATPGVYGARMTGGGFGGCVVALTEPGALSYGWVVRAVDGAHVER